MVTKAGAETLPWLSSCVILPASMGYFMLYKKMVGAQTFPESSSYTLPGLTIL